MKTITSKKYIKMAQINNNPLKEKAWNAIEQRFLEIKPILLTPDGEKENVGSDEIYKYKGRADDPKYIAGQFLQSFDRPITPEIISRISLGEYDSLIEQIWHNSAANEGHYGIGGSKNL